MRVIVKDDKGDEVFSYASPEKHPGELNTLCSVDNKKVVIAALAESIVIMCDSQFPLG